MPIDPGITTLIDRLTGPFDHPPVAVRCIASSLGLAIIDETAGDENIGASINFHSPIIRINPIQPAPHQRLAIAVLIGHWLIHTNRGRSPANPVRIAFCNPYADRTSDGLDAISIAIEILMPEHLICHILEYGIDVEIPWLFEVPDSVWSLRKSRNALTRSASSDTEAEFSCENRIPTADLIDA